MENSSPLELGPSASVLSLIVGMFWGSKWIWGACGAELGARGDCGVSWMFLYSLPCSPSRALAVRDLFTGRTMNDAAMASICSCCFSTWIQCQLRIKDKILCLKKPAHPHPPVMCPPSPPQSGTQVSVLDFGNRPMGSGSEPLGRRSRQRRCIGEAVRTLCPQCRGYKQPTVRTRMCHSCQL